MNRPFTVRAAAIAALVLAAACSSSSTPPGDPCAPAAITAGLGCEFWPTVTANMADGAFSFGIALVNPGSADASVHLGGGALGTGVDLTVPARSSVSRTLPWNDTLKACTATGAPCTAATGSSLVASGGAYHVASTQPLAAFQFSPLPGGYEQSYASLDATALPGAHALGTSHVAASWAGAGAGALPGFVAVTAVEDGTAVTVTATTAVAAGALPALTAGVPQSVTLDRGDVLELLASDGDLTGTRVDSDRPIQVIGGHFCATVPVGTPSCDHLEEVIPPLAALDATYVVAKPAYSSKPVVVRIVGIQDGTAITYSPSVPGAPGTLAAGQFGEFALPITSGIVEIVANHPVLVAEYMEGQSYAGIDGYGDPSMAIAQPVSRWRTSYDVDVPDASVAAYLDVIAPVGAQVSFGGSVVASTSRYQLSYGGTSAPVRVSANAPFALSAYAYGNGWSFWYAPAFAP